MISVLQQPGKASRELSRRIFGADVSGTQIPAGLELKGTDA